MSLFAKPLGEVGFQDVATLVQSKEPEGLRLDWKSDFPDGKNLAKTVAAFGNVAGGIMVIGVRADQEGRPEPLESIRGVALKGGLADRVTNTCAARIRPRIDPEVRVIEMPERSGRCLVLVRVGQSPYAPHYLPDYDGEPLIPLRMGAKSVRADLPAIEILLRQRGGDAAAAKRRDAMRWTPDVFGTFRSKTNQEITPEQAFAVVIRVFALGGPEHLCTFTQQMDEFILAHLPYESPLGGTMARTPSGALVEEKGFEPQRSQDAVTFDSVGFDHEKNPVCLRVRVTEKGAVHFASLVMREGFRFLPLVQNLAETLRLARLFFDRTGYFGEMGLDFMLLDVKETPMTWGGHAFKFQGPQHVRIQEAFGSDLLRDAPAEIVKVVTRRWLREGNLPVSEEGLEEAARDLFSGPTVS